MTSDDRNRFEPEHLRQWWDTTRYYLFADLDSLPGIATAAEDGWLPPKSASRNGRKRFIARVKSRLLCAVKGAGKDDPLRELERAFQRQIAFIARHPEVPQRLLSWLARDDDPGLQRRVRILIGHYAARLARIIARARQQGQVRPDIDPNVAALFLVGVIQGLVLRIPAMPQAQGGFLREAIEAFALYRAAATWRGLPRMQPIMPEEDVQ